MSDLLVILNPRRIAECMSAFAELRIDKLWVRCMREIHIAERWEEIMDVARGHTYLVVVSDDGIVRPHALRNVLSLLHEGHGLEHPVVTGYSNLAADDFRVNLCKSPLLGDLPEPHAYDLYTLAEVMEYERPTVPTWFAGMCLTGMPYELWEQFPFQVTAKGAQSDWALSKRLEHAGVPIAAARDSFVWHVKERWNQGDLEPRKRLVDGPAQLILEAA